MASDKNTALDSDWRKISISDWHVHAPGVDFELGPLNLELSRLEIVGLVGGSGSGKSLLIRSLLGLLPSGFHFSNSSKITIEFADGTSLTQYPAQMEETDWLRLRRYILAYLPQDPIPSFNPVVKLSKQFLQIERLYHSAPVALGEKLADLGLDDHIFLKRYPHELSGGQAQRLAFALTEALPYRAIIADEPTASLDRYLVNRTADMIMAWGSEGGAALVSSHDWSFLEKICHRVYVINNGKIIESGIAGLVLSSPTSETARSMKNAVLTGPFRTPGTADQGEFRTSIQCKEIGVTYKARNGQVALKDVSFDASNIRFLGIYGPSGSGKSTLAKVASGLLAPQKGSVIINGDEVDFDEPERFLKLSGQVQYIAQDPFSAFSPRMRVGASIREALDLHKNGHDPDTALQKLEYWMGKAGLALSLLERLPGKLSGGERQRLALIRALACSPGVLILDEITASLDHLNRKSILELIREICVKENMGYWIISHDPEVLSFMSEKIMTINDGRILKMEDADTWEQKNFG